MARSDRKIENANFLKIYKKIIELYNAAAKYSDVKIRCQNEVFNCQRLPLAAASPYFDTLFTESSAANNARQEVRLTIFDAPTFRTILEYVYEGEVTIHNGNILSLLRASEVLEIPFIEERCVRYLTECNIPIDKAIEIFSYVCEKRKKSLLPVLSRFILKRIKFFCENSNFLNLPHNHVVRLLTYWPPSSSNEENALLKAIFQWASHSTQAGTDVNSVFVALTQNIQFRHVSPADIATYSGVNIIESGAGSNEAPIDVTIRVLSTEDVATFSDVHIIEIDADSDEAPIDGSIPLQNVQFLSTEDIADIRVIESDAGCNEAPTADLIPNVEVTLHAYIRTSVSYPSNNDREDRTYLFTYTQSNSDIEWRPRPVEPTINYMRSVAVRNRLYCLKKQGVLSFSVSSSADMSAATQLSMPPSYPQQSQSGFFVKKASNLMCGNKNNIYFYDESHFSMYDYGADRWSPISASPNRPSNPLCITCDDSRLFVLGSSKSKGKWGGKGRRMLAYDPRVGEWQRLQDSCLFHTIRDECCIHKGKIYVSCLKEDHTNYSSYGDTCIEGMELYDPVAEKWESVLKTPANTEIYHHRLISFNNLLWWVSDGYGEYSGDETISVHTYDSYSQNWDSMELLDSIIVNVYPSEIRTNEHLSVYKSLTDVVTFSQ